MPQAIMTGVSANKIDRQCHFMCVGKMLNGALKYTIKNNGT